MSNAFNPDGSKFGELKDKVVVLTGTFGSVVDSRSGKIGDHVISTNPMHF
jgi:hypothetical protein